MRGWSFILFLFFLSEYGFGSERITERERSAQTKTFNWGAKLGFNSTLPVVNSLVIDDISVGAENTRVEYKVGYMAAVFCRINFDRFFIQPSISLHRTESEIYFRLPENMTLRETAYVSDLNSRFNLKINSFELPVMIGYSIVKEGPFGLSFMAGPKIKYNYRIRYTTNLDNYNDIYTSDDRPFRMNLVGGVGVTLWRLFFDFTYEVGINHREKNFKTVEDHVPLPENIVIDKRLNMMGFSLGFLF
ncbi:MAG: porin family protein [Massilibacteroides sp.]|nr:porin family protein [Massilibacteroides sp.]